MEPVVDDGVLLSIGSRVCTSARWRWSSASESRAVTLVPALGGLRKSRARAGQPARLT